MDTVSINILIFLFILILIVIYLINNYAYFTSLVGNVPEIVPATSLSGAGGSADISSFFSLKAPQSLIDTEISSITISMPIKIATTTQTDLPISQYAIKASYNSAISGYYVSTDAIKYILGRGCRFVDFQVFIDTANKNVPIVSHSVANDSSIFGETELIATKLDTINTITLTDVLTTCSTSAFNSGISPNYGDPLFIRLRIKGPASIPFDTIADVIENTIGGQIYGGKTPKLIDGELPLKYIMGKIVLLIECNNTTMQNYGNRFIGLKKYYYKDIGNMATNTPQINTKTTPSTVEITGGTLMPSILSPSARDDSNSIVIPSPFSVFAEYGIQIMCVPFYLRNNKNISTYEQLFNNAGRGIVPFSYIISTCNDVLNGTG